jgi:hypothetical protein
MVHVYISADVPIRVEAVPFADRVNVRLGKAFPVVLVVERAAADSLLKAITAGRDELDAAKGEGNGAQPDV